MADEHLDQAARELKAHFGAAITPAQIQAIIQTIISLIGVFVPTPQPTPSKQPSPPTKS